MDRPKRRNLLNVLGPGILVAATGVGAGDLATGAFTGIHLGTTVLWAVLLGAAMKFMLTEGLARWQLATGDTLLEGCAKHFGLTAQVIFLAYLIFWSFFVSRALMGACGVTAAAMLFGSAKPGTIAAAAPWLGIAHSLIGIALVRWGGYRLFEKVMSVCIAAMFVTVVATAAMLADDPAAIFRGLVWPTIPQWKDEGLVWTIGLMGGVGGTVTILCYGYWIREEGRTGSDDLRACRIDLAAGYVMTAVFGVAMVIIGSTIGADQSGARLVVDLADRLQEPLGTFGRWAFLVGAWGAVSSSLLGVWQSVPYLFADSWSLLRSDGGQRAPINTAAPAYRGYLYGLAVLPMIGLWGKFEHMQKVYAVVGAAFIPMLAVALLLLSTPARHIGPRYRNRPLTTLALAATLLFFVVAVGFKIYAIWSR